MEQVEMNEVKKSADIRLVPLDVLCKFIGGGTPDRSKPEYWNGDISWVTVKDINSKYIKGAQESISIKGLKNSATNLIPEGSIIIPTRMALGRVAILKIEAAINQDLKAIEIKSPFLDHDFLYYFILSKAEYLNSKGKGATVKGITLDILKELQIPLPPLETQKRIAAILDKADALRRKDQELLQKYDDLAQAIFFEMFGDPVKNEKGWEEIEIVSCCESNDDIRCGPFGTQLLQSEFKKSGVPLWGIKHVNSGFKKTTHEFLTEEKALELDNYSLHRGDIVMTRKGTIGNSSVYEFDKMGVMHSDLLRVRVNPKVCNPYFLSYQFKYSPKMVRQIEQISQGAIMSGINVSKLKSLKVFLPPIERQNQFKSCLGKIGSAMKNLEVKRSESLFQSLLQKAFTGELVA